MKKVLKNLFFFVILSGVAQFSEAADTIKINLTYKHKLNDAGQTTGYITTNQKFYSPDGILFREISYDETTLLISSYVFYFYRSGKLFTEEVHNSSDSLMYILKHDYDQAGYETQVTKMIPVGSGLINAGKTVMNYDSRHLLLRTKKYSGERLSAVTQYKYDPAGRLINENTSYKPAAKALLKKENRVYAHSENGKISQVTITGKDLAGKSFQSNEAYGYTGQGWLSSVVVNGTNSVQVGKKVYKYFPSGGMSLYEEYDSNGKIILLLQYDYKKHYMDTGTQVSYYENL
jgi:YD repeat-containing protein